MRTWPRTDGRTALRTFNRNGGGLPPVVTDPEFGDTVLLLSGDGTNGAQNNTFLDGSTNNFTITRNGNTTQGTFSPFSQTGWSNYFDGSGDYLSVGSNSAFNMNTYASLEVFVYFNSFANETLIFGKESFWLGYGVASLGGTNGKLSFNVYNGSAWASATASSFAPVSGTWYHIVGIRDSGTLRIYINGTQIATTSVTGVSNTLNTFHIGGSVYAGFLNVNGYISNARYITGASSSVLSYTGTSFTVPTTPLTALTGTVLLTCQSNRFIDNSTNAFAITVNGDVSVQAFSPFNPTAAWSAATNGGSGYFDGSGDNLTVPDDAAFTMSNGDFTIEGWIYPLLSTRQSICWQGDNAGVNTSASFSMEITAATKLRGSVYELVNAYDATSTASIAVNAWSHIALVRNGNTTTVYLNGTADGTANVTGVSINDSAQPVKIGDYTTAGGGLPFSGYLSGFRIVKGTAVYTSNFTPPTAPLTAITNTSLLLNFTNAGILDATAKNDLETVGNAQISTAQSKFGGSSILFDGTGDWLFAPASQNWEFGSGDFTVEMWVNPSSTTTTDALISKGNASSTGNEVWTLQWGSGNKLEFYSGGGLGTPIVISTTAFSTGTWYHVAITRASGTTRIFVDGALEASSTTSYTVTVGGALYVGAGWYAPSSRDTSGYIDDLRITKGVARYTAAFTPPTAAFPLR